MAVVQNIKGTSYSSFSIAKNGVVIYQGSNVPDDLNGNNGDLYIYKHTTTPKIYQKQNGVWAPILSSHQNLTDIVNFTLASNTFVGSDGSNLVLRNAETSRTALGLGTAATLDAGVSQNNVPVLDSNGKLPVGVIPARALIDVFHVATVVDRDALTVQAGDVSIVAENDYTYMYDGSAWQLMATTSGVMGIQTTTVVKNGVVTLDAATDILSGTLPNQRGGTGYSTYNQGDLLLGNNTTGLSKLPVGTVGKILVSDGTTASWSDAPATSVTFTPSTTHNIAASNVQTAIVEIASERAFIKVSTTNPTAMDDESTNLKVGDIWVNTTDTRIWFCVDNTISDAIWSESSTSILPTNVFWVSANGNDTNDGSLNRSWATIQHAVDSMTNGSVCFVNAGTYSGSVIIDGKTSISIIGNNTTIDGRITIINSTYTLLKDLKITNSSVECVNVGLSASNTILDNVTLIRGSADQNALVVTGVTTGDTFVKNSTITGRVSNTQTSNKLYVENSSSATMRFEAVSSTTVVSNCSQIGQIYHSGGMFIAHNIGTVVKNGSGVGLQSIADDTSGNGLRLYNVSTRQLDGTYAQIIKNANAPYTFANLDRNITETYVGVRTFAQWSNDIAGNYTATNYTGGESLKDHLTGIDTRLGLVGTFQQLTDAVDYSVSDANKILKVNNGGTGIEYGVVLGDIATHNVSEFATATQGSKADTSIQSSDLSSVALSSGGKFTNLYDVPTSYTGHSDKILKVNSAGNALEFGSVLHTVAVSGSYNDLVDKPTLGTASGYNIGTTQGTIPVLSTGGKLDSSLLPPIAITDVYVVADITERNSLSVQGGDVAKVTSEGRSYIFDGTTWIDFQSPDLIQSVNGYVGEVVLLGSDIDTNTTPTNYTSAGTTIAEHLNGIDTKFGTLGTASVANIGTSSGNVPSLDSGGKLNISTIPSRAITNVYEVADITERDALTVDEGDFAKVTGGSTYVKTSTAWLELSAPQSVSSVNGYVGTVVLNAADINAGRSGTNYTQTDGTVQQHLDAIDTSLGIRLINPTTTAGDLIYNNGTNTVRLGIGSDGTYLSVVGGLPTWSSLSSIPSTLDDLTTVTLTTPGNKQVLMYDTGTSQWINGTQSYNDLSDKPSLYSDPLTTEGDLLVRGSSSTTRLSVGTNGQVLTVVAGVPTWQASAGGDKIVTSTTSVETNQVTSVVTVNANAKRVAHFIGATGASSGERINITNDNQAAILESANTAGTGNVDLILKTQASGQVKIQTSGQTMLTTDAGETITIQPGSVTSGVGSQVEIHGGNTTASGQNGGDIVFTPGNGGSGATTGQVKLSSGYTPTTSDSVVTKNWVETRTLNVFSSPTTSLSMGTQRLTNLGEPLTSTDAATKNYVDTNSGSKYSINVNVSNTTVNLTANDQVLVNRIPSQSSVINVYMPVGATAGVGKWYTIKDGSGNAQTYNIIIHGNGAEKIDGSSTHTIDLNRESVTLTWDGTEWVMI